jgi:hypothetical protein
MLGFYNLNPTKLNVAYSNARVDSERDAAYRWPRFVFEVGPRKGAFWVNFRSLQALRLDFGEQYHNLR